jgi:hypothetical protein
MADEYVLTHKLIFWKNKELEVSRIWIMFRIESFL